jgi:hypothetical protein
VKQQELTGLAHIPQLTVLLVVEKKLTLYNRRLMVSPVVQFLGEI